MHDYVLHKTNLVHKTAYIDWGFVVVGENNIFGPYCVIGSIGEIKNKKYEDFKGAINIGNNNIINSFVSIDRPYKMASTVIGDNNFIMKHCHIGHDVKMGNDCIIRAGTMLGGYVTLDDYCNTGMNAVIRNRIRIGEGSYVGMGGILTKDLEPFRVAYGNPARVKSDNIVQIKERELTMFEVIAIREKWKHNG